LHWRRLLLARSRTFGEHSDQPQFFFGGIYLL